MLNHLDFTVRHVYSQERSKTMLNKRKSTMLDTA